MKKNIIGIILLIILMILSFIGISSKLYSKPNLPNDTIIVIPKVQDTVININGKYGTFIGDSHTSNHNSGWQVVVCKKTGLRMNNLSVSGKTTGWMLETAKTSLHKGIDYCFVYGGANDMFTKSITPKRAVSNIQQIVDLCHTYNIRCVVLTGFDPVKCTRTSNPAYGPKYAQFQKMLMDSISGATVVDTRVIDRTGCWDELCHMNPEGHKKIGMKVIQTMKFHIIK